MALVEITRNSRLEPMSLHLLQEVGRCHGDAGGVTDDGIDAAPRAERCLVIVYPFFDLSRRERRAAIETAAERTGFDFRSMFGAVLVRADYDVVHGSLLATGAWVVQWPLAVRYDVGHRNPRPVLGRETLFI